MYDVDDVVIYLFDLIVKVVELGIIVINIFEDFDGIVEYCFSVINVLVVEVLVYGDMGLVLLILVFGGVVFVFIYWGSVD